jgi:pimeloyl-ACP methyl ester carboxylesterase
MDTAEKFLFADTYDRLKMAQDDASAPALRRLLGAPAYAELRSLAARRLGGSHLGFGDAKNLIFVPGVMGTLLMNRARAGIWWIDVRTRNFIDHLGLSPDGISDADPQNDIAPATADPTYEPFLSAALAESGLGHVIFPYDWRKSLTRSAAALRDLVVKVHEENGRKPVHLVAHSMGGLMVRAALMEHAAEIWPRVGKIVFLATPHYGATAIAGYLKNHLWGFEAMAVLGIYLSRNTLRSLWGVLGLLPAPRGTYPGTRPTDRGKWQPQEGNGRYIHPCANFDLYQADSWKLDLTGQEQENLQGILNATAEFHRRMYETHRNLDQSQRDKMVVIAGVGFQTLFRLVYEPGFLGLWEKAGKIIHRVSNDPHREGDGRVPLASAMLENIADIRFVRGVHGGLPNIPAVYEDVFRCLKGKPMQLPKIVADALSGHLAGPNPSDAPYLDGTAAVSSGSDDPGFWRFDAPSAARLQELQDLLADDRLPEFARIHLL